MILSLSLFLSLLLTLTLALPLPKNHLKASGGEGLRQIAMAEEFDPWKTVAVDITNLQLTGRDVGGCVRSRPSRFQKIASINRGFWSMVGISAP